MSNLKKFNLDLEGDDSSQSSGLSFNNIPIVEKKKKSDYFYHVHNHDELFKIGTSYKNDYEKGVKSFSFTLANKLTSQNDTLLCLASYFEHTLSTCKIAIITDLSSDSHLAKEFHNSKSVFKDLQTENEKVLIKRLNDSVDIITIEELDRIHQHIKSESLLKNQFSHLFSTYDILLWGLPSVKMIKAQTEFYFALSRLIENVTFLITKEKTKKNEVQDLRDLFKNYCIPIKGVLLE